MKILVAVKRVVDHNVKIHVKTDGSGVDTTNVKMSMNPFDEIALEAAVQLKESGQAEEVVVVSIGGATCQETLRSALAVGADRAILIRNDTEGIQPLTAAKLLRALCERETPSIVLTGKQAIDDDANQTGQMLAALMGWPQATFASGVAVDGGTATVTREIDGGTETVEVTLPTVITADLRLNQPRYATLPNIMKARKKPIEVLTPEMLGVDIFPRLKTLKVSDSPRRAAGIRVADVAELVARLEDAEVFA
ncbi:MAG: electron transfer flavoprotein subunit beta/FixA family protein [Candidatus Accumulibacter sp.]|jgi:electron transfer flavoprotein beta subunit|nr:electron transfer flavoprotein subunit beta/FixA family protein [Accumulibacter sp.]